MMSEVKSNEHTFTIELKSKEYVNNISISDHTHDLVLFEGNLGKLIELSLVESDVLEIAGANGILRVTATMEQLDKALKEASKAQPKLRGGEL
jgi:predicted RNA-binding protein associated with RNAse of E/G family